MSKLMIDETGNRYVRLKVLGSAGTLKTGFQSSMARWLCECDCGVKIVTAGAYLRSGRKTYCGRTCPLKNTCVDCPAPATKYGRCVDCHHKTRPLT